MSAHTLALIEMLGVFGLVLAWAVRELWLLRRHRDPAERAPDSPARSDGESPGH